MAQKGALTVEQLFRFVSPPSHPFILITNDVAAWALASCPTASVPTTSSPPLYPLSFSVYDLFSFLDSPLFVSANTCFDCWIAVQARCFLPSHPFIPMTDDLEYIINNPVRRSISPVLLRIWLFQKELRDGLCSNTPSNILMSKLRTLTQVCTNVV